MCSMHLGVMVRNNIPQESQPALRDTITSWQTSASRGSLNQIRSKRARVLP